MATNGNPQQRNNAPQGGRPSGGGFTITGRTLAIGGGGIGVVVLIAVIVGVLLMTGVIGGGGGDGASGGGDVLGYVPGDAELVAIWDGRAFYGGDVPEDYTEYLEDQGLVEEGSHGFLEIDEDDIIVQALVDGELEILQGDFDFEIIREELEDGRDCESDDFRDFELWECQGEEYPAVALFEKDKYVVLASERQGHLEEVLTSKSRTPEKLANSDDSEIKKTLDRAGEGWLRIVAVGDCGIERCEGAAIAIEGSDDSENIPGTYAVMFRNDRAAAAAAEEGLEIDKLVEDMFAIFEMDMVVDDVEAEGEFVVGDGTAEFVDPDEPRSAVPGGGSSGEQSTYYATDPTEPVSLYPFTTVTAGTPAYSAPVPVGATATPFPTRVAATATPVPQLKPTSVFSLIPAETERILWVHWDQTSDGGYLPEDRSNIADRVFGTMDFFRKDLDVSPDSVSEIVLVNNGQMTVLKGSFDLAGVRAALERAAAEQDTYRGYELWQGGSRGGVFALFDEYIVHSGDRRLVQETLQHLYRGSGFSLGEASKNNDMVRVLDRLSDGIIVSARVRGCAFEHCLGYGWAITDINATDNTGPIQIEFLFRNDRAATAAAAEYDGIRRHMESAYGINVQDTVPDGSFVVGAAIWEFQ